LGWSTLGAANHLAVERSARAHERAAAKRKREEMEVNVELMETQTSNITWRKK
jgi:hypothetical protein